MSKGQRVKNVIFGIIMIIFSLLIMVYREGGYVLIVSILGTWLWLYGLSILVYFFTMARHMVGGKLILYKGIIINDFGYLTASLSDIPKIYVLAYLLAIHAFAGLIEILRALEAKRCPGSPWKMKFTHGIIDILMAASCIIFINKADTAVIIYGIGLIYSAIMRITGAFRKTVSVYSEQAAV